jgi:hypothetical protein
MDMGAAAAFLLRRLPSALDRLTLEYLLKFWAGFYLCWGMIAAVAAYTLCHSEIVWSGVRYRKHRGAVRRVLK